VRISRIHLVPKSLHIVHIPVMTSVFRVYYVVNLQKISIMVSNFLLHPCWFIIYLYICLKVVRVVNWIIILLFNLCLAIYLYVIVCILSPVSQLSATEIFDKSFYSLPVKTSPISACHRIVHSWYTNTPMTGVKKTLLKTPFIIKSRFFPIENWQSVESWYRWNNILLVYSTGFLQFTCQNG